jgi:hypothetical protein
VTGEQAVAREAALRLREKHALLASELANLADEERRPALEQIVSEAATQADEAERHALVLERASQ